MNFFSCLTNSKDHGRKFFQQRRANHPFWNTTIDRVRPQPWSLKPHPHSHDRQSKTSTRSENEASHGICQSTIPDPFHNPPKSFQNLDSTSKILPSACVRALNFAKAWRFIRRAVQRRSTSRPGTNLGRECPHSYDWFSWKRCFRPASS